MKKKDIFSEYHEIVAAIESLEEKKEVLREQMQKSLPVDGVENKYGKFGWMTKRKYKYSDRLVSMEEELKKERKVEELTGVATFTEVKSLHITVTK